MALVADHTQEVRQVELGELGGGRDDGGISSDERGALKSGDALPQGAEEADEGCAEHFFSPFHNESEDDGDEAIVPGNSSLVGAGCNFVNSIVGAGIIGLAFAVREIGFGLGITMLIFVAYLTYESVGMMISAGVQVNKRSYEGLCKFCFGKVGFNVVSIFMLIFAFGAMCAYFVIVGDTIPVVLLHMTGMHVERNAVITVFAIFVILPLCLLRDMSGLSWSSSISIIADAAVVLLVLIRAPTATMNWPVELDITPDYSFSGENVFTGLGAITFAYVCQHSSFIVFNTLKEPTFKNWQVVNKSSVSAAFVLSIFLAVGGYVTFFDSTQGNLLNNFDCNDISINLARLLLALTMVFTYPMEQFVARHSLFAFLNGFSPELSGTRRMSNCWHYGLTFGLWGSSLIVGLTFRDLGLILELTGALGASMLGYILPPMCYVKVNSLQGLFDKSRAVWRADDVEYNNKSLSYKIHATKEFVLPVFMWCFGMVAMFIGTFNALTTAPVKDGAQCVDLSSNITAP
eukprot:CAMPEP_0184549042 /NCGR_PEP_ID=MMETSP0199_2-20130426/6564_1 /TAXON_ID=1112570 /ORGANISM="Thraustochytrium sp., Strain LLF1b" /LENGTH=516 /DNA_ID=CAMNT_0026943727 /DNA_START=176 /DNA_END=1726 /DNA_ORIENTATION=-